VVVVVVMPVHDDGGDDDVSHDHDVLTMACSSLASGEASWGEPSFIWELLLAKILPGESSGTSLLKSDMRIISSSPRDPGRAAVWGRGSREVHVSRAYKEKP
jgi:hypothetical protein